MVLISFAVSIVLAVFYRPILELVSHFVTSFSYFDNSNDKVTAGGIWIVWAIELFISVFFMAAFFMKQETWNKLNVKIGRIASVNMVCVPIFVVYYIAFAFIGTQFNYLDRFGLYFMLFTIPLFINFGRVVDVNWRKYSSIYWLGLQICFIGYFVLSMRATQYQYVFGW